MLRQIKYFQAVVRHHSFSKAAEECFISQSAISQQVQALERELGFALLERRNRQFRLTLAGEYFYQKSLLLVMDYERLCREAAKIARGDDMTLKIGWLMSYNSRQFWTALEAFTMQYPQISLQLFSGNHEELFYLLRDEKLDLVLNDQRRAFSDEYANIILSSDQLYIELAAQNEFAKLPAVSLSELKNMPCILVAHSQQQEIEREYYQTVIGFEGDFLFAESLEEAMLLVISKRGFMPVEENSRSMDDGTLLRRLPLYRHQKEIRRNYCLFFKKQIIIMQQRHLPIF